MLVHHSGQDYNVAASEAAREARSKFEAEIERGKTRALAVIEQIHRDVPQDRIVRGTKLQFAPNGKRIEVILPDGERQGFHRHAIGQAAARAEIPLSFVDRFLDKDGGWGADLIAHNFNEV